MPLVFIFDAAALFLRFRAGFFFATFLFRACFLFTGFLRLAFFLVAAFALLFFLLRTAINSSLWDLSYPCRNRFFISTTNANRKRGEIVVLRHSLAE